MCPNLLLELQRLLHLLCHFGLPSGNQLLPRQALRGRSCRCGHVDIRIEVIVIVAEVAERMKAPGGRSCGVGGGLGEGPEVVLGDALAMRLERTHIIRVEQILGLLFCRRGYRAYS